MSILDKDFLQTNYTFNLISELYECYSKKNGIGGSSVTSKFIAEVDELIREQVPFGIRNFFIDEQLRMTAKSEKENFLVIQDSQFKAYIQQYIETYIRYLRSINPSLLTNQIEINEHTNVNDLQSDSNQIPTVSIEHSTLLNIEKHLIIYKERDILLPNDYINLVYALHHYIELKNWPNQSQVVKVGRVNKKIFARSLNNIFRDCISGNEPLEFNYIEGLQKMVSIFEYDFLKKKTYTKSNLYKYFTTKNP